MDAIYCERGWEFEPNAHSTLIETVKVLESRDALWFVRKDASPGDGQLGYEGWRGELVKKPLGVSLSVFIQ